MIAEVVSRDISAKPPTTGAITRASALLAVLAEFFLEWNRVTSCCALLQVEFPCLLVDIPVAFLLPLWLNQHTPSLQSALLGTFLLVCECSRAPDKVAPAPSSVVLRKRPSIRRFEMAL
jgi:hypothetical protein